MFVGSKTIFNCSLPFKLRTQFLFYIQVNRIETKTTNLETRNRNHACFYAIAEYPERKCIHFVESNRKYFQKIRHTMTVIKVAC